MYYFKVKISGDRELLKEQGLVDGKNFKDALDAIIEWYDEDELMSLELAPICNIVFSDDMKYIFSEDDDEKSD